jgi:hypothetical protein
VPHLESHCLRVRTALFFSFFHRSVLCLFLYFLVSFIPVLVSYFLVLALLLSKMAGNDEDFDMSSPPYFETASPPSSPTNVKSGLPHGDELPFPGELGLDGKHEVCYMEV